MKMTEDEFKKSSLLCTECKEELFLFPDDEWVCVNKECRLYAPNTYRNEDFSSTVSQAKRGAHQIKLKGKTK